MYFAILLAIPLLLIAVNRLLFSRKIRSRYLVMVNFLIIYGFHVGMAEYYDEKIHAELRSYDLNGDGGFSSDELTPEAELAMQRFTRDTGRTFAPIAGIFIAGFFSVIYCLEILLYRFIKRHLENT
tara:strand:+ start:1352 stop:1729 length:378 start_codon:yes stop_codon:yes gene_type:complete